MNVSDLPSVERFSASSDFELKLVTIWLVGTVSVPRRRPNVVMLSRKIGELTAKLGSDTSLLNTVGYVPSALATPQATATLDGLPPAVADGTETLPATHPGGRTSPTVTVDGVPT